MSGVFGKQNLSATTWTDVVLAPTSGTRVVTLNVCNRNSVSVTVRVAVTLSSNSTPGDGDMIEYDVTLPARGVLERTGLVVDAQHKIAVYSSSSGVSAVGYGIAGV